MCNEGRMDRAVRVLIGIAVIVWGIMTSNWLGAIGVVPLLTGLIGWCPLYAMIGLNTGCKTKEN